MNSTFPRAAAAILALALAAPAAAQGGGAMPTLDGNMVVDCLLPGAVRKLGANVTYLTPRKVGKVTVKECEVRGGEYVLFDRADPATALKIWKPAAEQGDAVAQFRLGQIYEMGLGGTPDYQSAATWYRKSADQGNRTAAFNLAVLYEKGQGVARDQAAALNLYRRAQGLTDDIGADADVRALRAALQQAQARINELEREISALRKTGGATGPKEQELKEVRARVDELLGGGKPVPVVLLVDVGPAAGSKPSIQLIDPSLVATRGQREIAVRGEIQSKQIVGRIKSRQGLASLTVNDNDVQPDKYGFFDTNVPVAPGGTSVRIVAVDRQGERDEVSLELKPGKSGTGDLSRPPVAVPKGTFGNYHALVIGNDLYRQWGQLRTAVNDANAVADLLRRRYGFKVRTLLNATFDQTLNALNDLVKTLKESDNLLIYYAGHGSRISSGAREAGYWLPVDADPPPNDAAWVANEFITDHLARINARRAIVIADSCYAGLLSTSPGMLFMGQGPDDSEEYLRYKLPRRARLLMTSGGDQPVIDNGGDGHSVFARVLLETLQNNTDILTAPELFLAVRDQVTRRAAASQFEQKPVYKIIEGAGHETGDFFFVPTALAGR
jgi:uncharacterized protein